MSPFHERGKLPEATGGLSTKHVEGLSRQGSTSSSEQAGEEFDFINPQSAKATSSFSKEHKQGLPKQDLTFHLEKEIDNLVYELYDLNADEIAIIEGE